MFQTLIEAGRAILVSTFLPLLVAAACARSGGPSDAGAAVSVTPPSALPPMPTATPSARANEDSWVSIPGVLTVRQTGTRSSSHGVLGAPWRASFLVENQTSGPLSVSVSELALRSNDAKLSPADQTQPIQVKYASGEGLTFRIENGVVTFTAPPHQAMELRIEGSVEQPLHVFYHVPYWHEATFSVGTARVIGRGDSLSFRRPLVRDP
jgi:hypothetical protein